MAYIGREPIHGAFEKQPLTADSSTTTFTLNYVVGSSSSIYGDHKKFPIKEKLER